MLKYRKELSDKFTELHKNLKSIRGTVENFDEPGAIDLVDQLELAVLAPMRRLRLYLDIPYGDPKDLTESELILYRRFRL
jgi:hypothetical protein